MLAGADAFRINMSHGDRKQKAKLVEAIRALEKEFHRPTTILFDLQGPKLRVGHFEGGRTVLEKGTRFIFDHSDKAGNNERVQLPHAELFDSVRPGTNILIDDAPDGYRDEYQGAPVRVRLRDRKGGDMAEWPVDLRVREFPR